MVSVLGKGMVDMGQIRLCEWRQGWEQELTSWKFKLSVSSEYGSVGSLVDRRVGVEGGMAVWTGQGTLNLWSSVTLSSSWNRRSGMR